jgi:hypothetical protein
MYGGIDNLDAGKFYHDSVILNDLAYKNVGEYMKMLFGLQDDSEGSYFFKTCIDTTHNWSNGQVKDFFYNDNRVVIRIHSLLHFIAFKSYFVHALFSCFLSFTGLFFIYRTFKQFFENKEILFFLVLALFPTLWLYTGGLLKEGITIFFFGLTLFYTRKLFSSQRNLRSTVFFLFLFFISLLLKPYILFFSVIFFSLFWMIYNSTFLFKALIFFTALVIFSVALNYGAILIKKKTLISAGFKREMEFKDLSTGGIFLLDSVKFVRVPYDTTFVERVVEKPNYFRIKPGVSYTYWEHSHQQDTLFCKSNTDAITTYSLVYKLPKAGSSIDVVQGSHNLFLISARSLYYTLFHPFFFNAKGIMQLFASTENLLLILSVLITIIGIVLQKKDRFPAIIFLAFGLIVFIIIGFTTPNSGAIMRYRSPAALFLIISALYYYPGLRKSK